MVHNFYRAMLFIARTVLSQYVCLSVTLSSKASKHVLKLSSLSGRVAILF